MNFDAFSHGQVISKLWLCEELERHTKFNSSIWILGSWYNLLAFMLHIRKPDYYSSIIGYDIDYHSKEIADKLCNAWTIYHPISVQNIIANSNELDWSNPPDIVINCSVEHFSDNTWFDSIPVGTLVCIQSSNIGDPNDPWYIKQPIPTINDFKSKFILSTHLMVGIKPIQLNKKGKFYERYMKIGYK
jgi:hypothetical protein